MTSSGVALVTKTNRTVTRPRPPNPDAKPLTGMRGENFSPGSRTRPLRVLIADDYIDAAESLGLLVRAWGHEAHLAYTGSEVLTTLFTSFPDVLVLDIDLPKIDGFQLARFIRGQVCFEDVLLIAMTGYADHANRRVGMEAGFDHYLAKPADLAAFRNVLVLEQDRLVPARRQIRRIIARPCLALEE